MSKPYEALLRMSAEDRKQDHREFERACVTTRKNRLAAHALLWGGLAAMIGGIYLLAGTGWAVIVGGFVAYATGWNLLNGKERRDAMADIRQRTETKRAELHRNAPFN
jgi:hypothetical protein